MIAIGLIQVAILLVSLLRAKGLALMLGPAGVGVISTMDQLIITITQVAAFGIPVAAMKFMSAAHSTSEDAFRDSFAAFSRVIVGLALVATATGMCVLFIFPNLFDTFLFQKRVWGAALLSVPPMMLSFLIAQTFAAAQMARSAAVFNFCFLAGVTVSGLSGAWLGGFEGFYIGTATAGSLVVVLGLAWLSQRLGLSILRKGVSIQQQLTIRPKLFGTAMTASISLVSFSASMLLVRFLVLVRLGEEPTGYLQAALGLALSLGSVVGAINALQLAPSMNRNQPNSERFRRAADFANRVALVTMAGAVPLALLPGLGLTILFTSEFVPAGMALVLCLIWQAGHQLRITCLQLLIGTDHPLSGALAVTLALGVTASVAILLLQPLGILAAPVGLILGDVAAIGLMLARLRSAVAMPVPWEVLARFAVAAAALLGAGLLFDPTIIVPDMEGLALRLLFATVSISIFWFTMPSHLSPAAALDWFRNRRQR